MMIFTIHGLFDSVTMMAFFARLYYQKALFKYFLFCVSVLAVYRPALPELVQTAS